MSGELRVRLVPVAELAPFERNARTHSAEQVRQIADSILAYGWTNPILVDEDGMILAGHGRLEAAKLLGLAAVPVLALAGLSEEEKRAYILADNKIALNSRWDVKVLRVELTELDDAEFDLSLTGFDSAEIDEILAGEDESKGLAERFGGFVPFTVFDARDERWIAVETQWRSKLNLRADFSPTALQMMLRLFCPARGAVAVLGDDADAGALARRLGCSVTEAGADCLVGFRAGLDLLADDLDGYRRMLAGATASLRDDAFACVVVDDVAAGGRVRDAIGATVEAFAACGLRYHNEAVIVWGEPVRAAPRGLMPRCHSALLVFVKGDPKRAASRVGESYPEEARCDA